MPSCILNPTSVEADVLVVLIRADMEVAAVATSNGAIGVIVPIPKLPAASNLTLSILLVANTNGSFSYVHK